MKNTSGFSKKYPQAIIEKMAKDFWNKQENRDRYKILYERYILKNEGNGNENIYVASACRAVVYGGL